MSRMEQIVEVGSKILDEWRTYCSENELPWSEKVYMGPLFYETERGQWMVDTFCIYWPVDVPESDLERINGEIKFFTEDFLGPLYEHVNVKIFYNVVVNGQEK